MLLIMCASDVSSNELYIKRNKAIISLLKRRLYNSCDRVDETLCRNKIQFSNLYKYTSGRNETMETEYSTKSIRISLFHCQTSVKPYTSNEQKIVHIFKTKKTSALSSRLYNSKNASHVTNALYMPLKKFESTTMHRQRRRIIYSSSERHRETRLKCARESAYYLWKTALRAS